jgi:hypothetical protein
MSLDDITPSTLKLTLKSFRRGLSPPETLLNIHLLARCPDSRIARTLYLQECLYNLVSQHLLAHRRALGIPDTDPAGDDTYEAIGRSLQRDFQTGSLALFAWSALYYRYLHPIELSVGTLAEFAQVSERHFRRYVGQGLEYATRAFQRLEWHATAQR